MPMYITQDLNIIEGSTFATAIYTHVSLKSTIIRRDATKSKAHILLWGTSS
jgi:hypothetical protein